MNWKHKLKIRHLLVSEENDEGIKKMLIDIGDELKKHSFMDNFNVSLFYEVEDNLGIMTHLDYINELLQRLYDYCDANAIWIEI